MKKWLFLPLALCLSLALAACDGSFLSGLDESGQTEIFSGIESVTNSPEVETVPESMPEDTAETESITESAPEDTTETESIAESALEDTTETESITESVPDTKCAFVFLTVS